MATKSHVRKDDTVVVLAGKDRGKKGKVLEVLPEKSRVLVEGINVVKRHTKPRPPRFPQGGIVEKPMPLAASNVMLVCPRCSKPTRQAHKPVDQDGDTRNVRVCKKCGEEI
ncbi:MAG: 50S ribosomal protein L24 [Armatimonadetes bacterium]|nr:50S ribosomal protein L24 [Armatimonadota bacterium]